MRIAWFIKEHRIVSGVILFDIVIVVILVAMMIMKAGKTATVDIMTVPSIAKVKIGGAEYSSGAHKVHPGDYEAEVKADGFVTKTVPVNARDGEISKVWVYLVPEEGNLNYYAQHEEDWENMKLINDEEAQRVWKVLSIREELPMEYIEQNEDGEEGLIVSKYIVIKEILGECESYYCVRVATINAKYENVVREMLAEKGLKYDDYGIEWTVYTGESMGGDALAEMREGEW